MTIKTKKLKLSLKGTATSRFQLNIEKKKTIRFYTILFGRPWKSRGITFDEKSMLTHKHFLN